MTAAQKTKAIKAAIQTMESMFGPNVIRQGKELAPPKAMPTGLPELDAALGIGGIPVGRIVEIYGPESTGKTALALHIAKQAQNALFIDAERALSPMMLTGCDGMHIMSVDTLQEALQTILTAAPAFDVIVLDTLASLPTREELAMDVGDFGQINPPARVLSTVLPKIVAALEKNGSTLLIVNQMRNASVVMYGNPERVPGGKALKHYASMRLDVRRNETLREGRDIAGQRIRVKVVKNKCAVPFREAALDLMYGVGFVSSNRFVPHSKDLSA